MIATETKLKVLKIFIWILGGIGLGLVIHEIGFLAALGIALFVGAQSASDYIHRLEEE